MVILIAGASRTGKTLLAQKLMERYGYPVLSIDLLKMGLIRSGQTQLTPEDDELLVPYLWGIVREMIKTAIENEQNLIIEGCYIPFDWKEGFEPAYLAEIEFICLIMTRRYLETHGDDLERFGNAIEKRLFDEIDIEGLAVENERNLASCLASDLRYCLIDDTYNVGCLEVSQLSDADLDEPARLFHKTVHSVNARDYTQEQVDAWAPREEQHLAQIVKKLSKQQVVGVKECGILIGLGSLDDDGIIDMLYVHKDRQSQGVGGILRKELERLTGERGYRSVTLFSSITAKPFFESAGYIAECENVVVRNGVSLVNYRMCKQLS